MLTICIYGRILDPTVILNYTGDRALGRPKIFGFIALVISSALAGLFIYSVFIIKNDYSLGTDLTTVHDWTFYALAIPIGLVALFVAATGFWIGWTILTIKVVPPMPEIVEKRDFSKIKAFFLCLFTAGVAAMLIYGLYVRNFWALAVPAAAISLVVLGSVFWVGIAIITTRSTLPKKQ